MKLFCIDGPEDGMEVEVRNTLSLGDQVRVPGDDKIHIYTICAYSSEEGLKFGLEYSDTAGELGLLCIGGPNHGNTAVPEDNVPTVEVDGCLYTKAAVSIHSYSSPEGYGIDVLVAEDTDMLAAINALIMGITNPQQP